MVVLLGNVNRIVIADIKDTNAAAVPLTALTCLQRSARINDTRS